MTSEHKSTGEPLGRPVSAWPWLEGEGSAVRLSFGDAQPSLFIAHGHLPGIGFELLLTPYFPDRSVFLLTPWLREQEGSDLLPTIELQAESYLGDIRRHQPNGPYWLMGYSASGFVALDMARQLSEAGETVKLALVDVDFEWRRSVALTGDDPGDYCALWEAYFPGLIRQLDGVAGKDERCRALIEMIVEWKPDDAWRQYVRSLAEIDLSYGHRFVHAHVALVKSMADYDVTRYRGQFALLELDGPDPQTGERCSDEWARVGIHPVLRRLPGTHSSVFSDASNLKQLAGALRGYFESAT
jgi:hypothetical protein